MGFMGRSAKLKFRTINAILSLAILSTVVPFARAQQRIDVTGLEKGFRQPPDSSKIMMRWWWFGPSVTRPELEREMRMMKAGGIGGFEVQPTYPLMPDDPVRGIRNLPFLSPEFLDDLRFTSAKAHELGLRMDLTLGSGWPFGGPTVAAPDAAGMLRTDRVSLDKSNRRIPLPSLTSGENLIAAFVEHVDDEKITPGSIRQVSDIRDGYLNLPANTGSANELLFFISSRTGMQVKRPALGAEGFVLDHLNRPAAERYLHSVGDTLMQAFPNRKPYSIFCDSLEVYNQDWTADFPAEFQRRRGYDITPYLPALVKDIGPETAAIRHDWGQTLTEMLNDRFLSTVHEWAKKNGTLFRIQNYGIPSAALSSNAFEDLPEGEGPQWKVLRAARWASSASHIFGRPVTSSETWTWLHSPVFRATPLDMKAEADLHFLQGINQLIGHGWPYTPESVEYPGWRFYAAAVFDEKNPWWIVMPDVAAYLQRMSYVLRQGQPANDVALYLPNSDAWAGMSAGHTHMIDMLRELLGPEVLPGILESGYNLDFFEDAILKGQGRVDGNSLVLGPNKYRVVVLPGVERIPLETMKTLEQFVRGGGTLIATRRLPDTVPGLQASKAEQAELKAIIRRLFTGKEAPARFAADEKGDLKSVLNRGLSPDLDLTPAVADIGFIHRSLADAEVYFVANTSNQRQNVTASFRVAGLTPEIWDPMSGVTGLALTATEQIGRTSIPLDIEPYGSRLVVFSKHKALRTPQPSGETVGHLDISRDWKVTFGQNAAVSMDTLRSWTTDESTRYFSGTATYQKDIDVQADFLRFGSRVKLDLGEGKPLPVQSLKAGMQTWLDAPVREAAVVYVNDKRAGSVWAPPYNIDISKLLSPGRNRIRIEVANLAVNYMAGHRLPDYRLLNLRYGERFQAQDMDKIRPETAGLLGPISLVAVRAGNQ